MKAILVIDKPESCTSCMLGIYNKRWFCLATNEDINIADRYNIPKSCPLKPMPIKKEALMGMGKINFGKALGWNACLDAITGETEYNHKNTNQFGANHKNTVGNACLEEITDESNISD